MNHAQESPATQAWYDAPASSSSPRTYEPTFTVPSTPAEAEALLSAAEVLARKHCLTHAHLVQLARFLGANSEVWTVANRARLRRTLATAASDGGIDAILSVLQGHRRTDVLDEGELALRAVPAELASYLQAKLSDGTYAPLVRARVLRALARLPGVTAVRVVREALVAREPELREAGASLIAELELVGEKALLEGRLEREPSIQVQAAIRDALDALSE